MMEILLDPASASSAAKAHIESCADCRKELASLQETVALLDTWKAPEPSVYFDQKLAVRLREEQMLPPASFLERLKDRLLFNTGRQLRPALLGAMALVLLLGGGTFAGIESFTSSATIATRPHTAQASPAVDDLQILDRNDQALQQMDQLLEDDQASSKDNSSNVPIS